MKNYKEIFISVVKGLYLSKTETPKDQEDIKKMSKVPYAQAVDNLIWGLLLVLDQIYAMQLDW